MLDSHVYHANLKSFCRNYGEKKAILARNKQNEASCKESKDLPRQEVEFIKRLPYDLS